MRLPLLGGAYYAKSFSANAQKCVNLYPELNPQSSQAPVPVTHYHTPGLRLLVTPDYPAVGRGAYRATDGQCFCVLGDKVFTVGPPPNWTLTHIGTIKQGTNTVSMADNGIDVVLVDGTNNGYVINLSTLAFSQIVDPAFYGADRVDYLDTFFVFNRPDTNQWYCSLSNSVSFDSLDIAAKTGGADFISSVIVKHREAWVLGLFTSEIWSLVGGADFPFAPNQGAFIDHGSIAKYSVAKVDVSVFCLSQDSSGRGLVMQSKGYNFEVISTRALENEIQQYQRIDDAIGYIYQQGGHTFYVLIFPQADKTWVYDLSTQQWHEWAWVDNNGKLHRHRGNCYAFMHGENVVIDFQNGKLYALDPNKHTDNGQPIVRVRSFPHVVADGNRISISRILADVGVGDIEGYATEDVTVSDFNWDFNNDFGATPSTLIAPRIFLRVSRNKGKSYGTAIERRMGSTGQYNTWPRWAPIGISRDFVFELSWSINGPAALNGVFYEPKQART